LLEQRCSLPQSALVRHPGLQLLWRQTCPEGQSLFEAHPETQVSVVRSQRLPDPQAALLRQPVRHFEVDGSQICPPAQSLSVRQIASQTPFVHCSVARQFTLEMQPARHTPAARSHDDPTGQSFCVAHARRQA
jgi:hypothetical protein